MATDDEQLAGSPVRCKRRVLLGHRINYLKLAAFLVNNNCLRILFNLLVAGALSNIYSFYTVVFLCYEILLQIFWNG